MNFDKQITASILDKFGRDDRSTPESLAKLTFTELYSRLTPAETRIVKQLLSINPKELGFNGPFITLDDPKNLVEIKNQTYTYNSKKFVIPTQYLPENVLTHLKKMQSAFKREKDRRLLVESGYRSPAQQVIVFLTYLEMNKFNIKYTAQRVALPGYSQHGDPINTAMDFKNQDGVPTDKDPQLFAETQEYEWLSSKAKQFGFYLSYPKDNEWGVMFEPWHWQFNWTHME